MKSHLRLISSFLLLTAPFTPTLLGQTPEEELRLGVQAYKSARFEEAIQHFEKCVAIAPDNPKAHLYLATAYAQQYIPGVDIPENDRLAELAIAQYELVLVGHPDPEARINSAKGIAYLNLQRKKFEEAKKFYRMASDLGPDDPENYYSIGVIDWTASYAPRMEARAKLGLKPAAWLGARDKGVCREIRGQNSPTVQEGIDNLNKALELRPDYDDAMAYMNLMYRERADIQCDDRAAHDADLRTADEWVDRTMATKKAKAKADRKGRKVKGGVVDPQ
ncbi:MAG TPA: tetratricopeptide repeat protein [Terriglobales bacterium]|nr:tetratricopeptide repeat protein [Terriglobales bacterium]